jgi:hypothetical protein
MLTKTKREYVDHLLAKDDTGFTDKMFASMLGLHPNTVKAWKIQPEVVAAYEAGLKEQEATKSVFGAKTFIWSLEEAVIAYKAAEGGEKRQWWKLIRDLTADSAPGSTRVDYSQWCDEDLEAEWSRRGLSETEAAIEAAKGAVA